MLSACIYFQIIDYAFLIELCKFLRIIGCKVFLIMLNVRKMLCSADKIQKPVPPLFGYVDLSQDI
jgi:hypothetical protein